MGANYRAGGEIMSKTAWPNTIGGWLRYIGAWLSYLSKMGALIGGIGLAIWYGFTRAGLLGAGLAVVFLSFVFWIFQDDNFERALGAVGALLAFAFAAGVVVAGIVGFGYLFGVGMEMAR